MFVFTLPLISTNSCNLDLALEKRFAYHRSLEYFDVIPEIKNGKTYASEVFLDLLL